MDRSSTLRKIRENAFERVARVSKLLGRLALREQGLRLGDIVKGPLGTGPIVDAWDDSWLKGFAFINVNAVRMAVDASQFSQYTKVT